MEEDNNTIQLADLKPNEKAKIVGFTSTTNAYQQKLLAMGLTPGTLIILKRIAPLGDPIEIIVRDYSLVLRKQEANILILKKAIG